VAVSEHSTPRPASARPVIVIDRAFVAADAQALGERLCVALGTGSGETILCDASALVQADLATIDGLARLALATRRLGHGLRLCQASSELTGLMALVGLTGVVPCVESAVEPRRQAEHREELGGVEEEDDPADAPA
jgi:anti-anti-sigma regulatory factor